MEIFKLTYNWVQVGDLESGLGEDFDTYEIGMMSGFIKSNVSSITQHNPYLDGDKLHYTVCFEDGQEVDVFNPNMVYRK